MKAWLKKLLTITADVGGGGGGASTLIYICGIASTLSKFLTK